MALLFRKKTQQTKTPQLVFFFFCDIIFQVQTHERIVKATL